MNTGHTARTAPIFNAAREGLARDVLILSLASVVAIGSCFILAVLGVPLHEIDRWMLILSLPWFATLYFLSRRIDLVTKTLGKAVLAITSAVAALVGSVSYASYFVFDAVKYMIDKLHMW